MNHNWAQISYSTPYQAHLKNQTLMESKESKIYKGEIARGYFSKITETACLPGTELGMDNNPVRR